MKGQYFLFGTLRFVHLVIIFLFGICDLVLGYYPFLFIPEGIYRIK